MKLTPERIAKYETWVDLIRSDQMSHEQIYDFLRQYPDFASWYMAEKIRDTYTNALDD